MTKILFNIIVLLLVILFIDYFFIYEKYQEIDDNAPEYQKDQDFLDFINQYTYYDENDQIIDHNSLEIEEQYQVYKYIDPNDIVLEVGGRYGTVSVLINKILKNKKNHVVVEPDTTIISALEKNRDNNNCQFNILNKFISNTSKKIFFDGYSTRIVDNINDIRVDENETEEERIINNEKRFFIDDKDNIFSITYDNFKKKYPLKFNVLVADCEGCLGELFDMMGNDIDNYNKIIFEADQPEICNYQNILNILEKRGFKLIDNSFNVVDRYVFIKQ